MTTISDINNTSYTALLTSLNSADATNSAKSVKNQLAMQLLGINNSSKDSDTIQSIDLSEYYEKLNSLGYETSDTSSNSNSNSVDLQSILTNALENDELSASQISKINKAMLAYSTNSSLLNSTFQISI